MKGPFIVKFKNVYGGEKNSDIYSVRVWADSKEEAKESFFARQYEPEYLEVVKVEFDQDFVMQLTEMMKREELA